MSNHTDTETTYLKSLDCRKQAEKCSDAELLTAIIVNGSISYSESGSVRGGATRRLDNLLLEASIRLSIHEPTPQRADLLIALIQLSDFDDGIFDDDPWPYKKRYTSQRSKYLKANDVTPFLTDEQLAILTYTAGTKGRASNARKQVDQMVTGWLDEDWNLPQVQLCRRISAMAMSPMFRKRPEILGKIEDCLPSLVHKEAFEKLPDEEVIALYQCLITLDMKTDEFEIDKETKNLLKAPQPGWGNLARAYCSFFEGFCAQYDQWEEFAREHEDSQEDDDDDDDDDGMTDGEKKILAKLASDFTSDVARQIMGFVAQCFPEQYDKAIKAKSAKDSATVRSYRLKIELEGVEKPQVWREVWVDGSLTLDQLHEVIQAAFGWQNYHLYQFVDGNGFGREDTFIKIPDEFDAEIENTTLDSRKITVDEVLGDNKNWFYIYDLGDNWAHRITVMEVVDHAMPRRALCLDGQGTCPPEDVGGSGGYALMKEALSDRKHPEYQPYRQWLGLGHKRTFDADAFSVEDANDALKSLF